jgi:hypothetical protein
MSEKEEAVDILTAKETSQDVLKGLPAPGSQARLLAERRLVRKLDMRLIPTVFIIFIMNYIDVSSLLFSVNGVVAQVLIAHWHYNCTTSGPATGLAY